MNHWFLCARDVMWFCIASFPIAGGWITANCFSEGDFGGGFWMLIMVLLVQYVGIAGIYLGVIK